MDALNETPQQKGTIACNAGSSALYAVRVFGEESADTIKCFLIDDRRVEPRVGFGLVSDSAHVDGVPEDVLKRCLHELVPALRLFLSLVVQDLVW